MQITPLAQGQASALFGDGQSPQNAANSGVFGVLLALLGGAGKVAAAPGQGGQFLPTSFPAGGQPVPFLPSVDPSGPAGPAAGAVSLLALLQSLNGGQPLSPDLQALLSGEQIDPEVLQQRLNALDSDRQDAVLAELAGLLQPLLPATLSLSPADASSSAGSLVAGGPASAVAPLPAAPAFPADGSSAPESAPGTPVMAPAFAPADQARQAGASANAGSASDELFSSAGSASQTERALAAITQLLQDRKLDAAQAARPLAADARTGQDATTPSSSPLAGAVAALAQAREQGRITDGSPVSARQVEAAEHDANGDSASAVVAQARGTQPVRTAYPSAPLAAVSGTDAANGSSAGDGGTQPVAAGRDGLPNTTALAAAPARFSDHLDHLRLNRTGAHVPVSEQVAVHLTRALHSGQERMTIRLHPAELGRIEVRLDMGGDGLVKASFHVDQPATLDLLQRDQRGLEKALGDAGLKMDGGSLNFNLRGDGAPHRHGGEQARQDGSGTGGSTFADMESGGGLTAAPAGVVEMAWYVGPDRVDLRI